MAKKENLKKLKGLLNRLAKKGIDVEEVLKKADIKGDTLNKAHPSTLKKFEKFVQRAIERQSIVKESAEITQRMRDRVAKAKDKNTLDKQVKTIKNKKAKAVDHKRFQTFNNYMHDKYGERLTQKQYDYFVYMSNLLYERTGKKDSEQTLEEILEAGIPNSKEKMEEILSKVASSIVQEENTLEAIGEPVVKDNLSTLANKIVKNGGRNV